MADDKPGVGGAVRHLEEIGYSNVRIIHHPVDIRAEKNGEVYWIEVKYSESKDGKMFGAATLTEWECALEHPNHFFFMIAHKPGGVEDSSKWKFHFISPCEFEPFSTVPPFKIYFNYDVNDPNRIPKRRSAIPATEENLRSLIRTFKSMKGEVE
jgi:hypothetical protein